MLQTPSDIYNVEVNKTLGIDFLDYEENNITMQQMLIQNTYPGKWKLCRIDDETVVFSNENIFKEIMNIETITNRLENTTITCSSMEEAMAIKSQIMKDKDSVDNSMEYMGALECVHQQKIDTEFVRLTPNIEKPINLNKKEKEEIFKVVSSPYGIANISKISKKSFLVKLFDEGTTIKIYNSFIGEIAFIEFTQIRQEQNLFDLFSETPKVVFTEE